MLALSLRSIATEAQNVGLIDISFRTPPSNACAPPAIRCVLEAGPRRPGGNDRLTELTDHERRLRNERSRLLTEISELREAFQEASQFVTTTSASSGACSGRSLRVQRRGHRTCPVCSNKIMQHTETLAHVRAAYRQLQLQLLTAERERPQIDDYISTLQTGSTA